MINNNETLPYLLNETDRGEHDSYDSTLVGYTNLNVVSLQKKKLFH